MKIVATYSATLFPRKADPNVTYTICKYKPMEKLKAPDGTTLHEITCKGYMLPQVRGIVYEFEGKYGKTSYGFHFDVESYHERILPEKSNIIAYLSSGQIKGIGPSTAKAIFDTFGVNALEILDNEPDRLLEVKGISEKKLKKIQESYLANRGARDVLAFLLPYGVSPRKAIQFYKRYGNETMQTVKSKPYTLCELRGIGFRIADAIAQKMGFDRLSPIRIEQAMIFAMQDAEKSGNTCLPGETLIENTLKVLSTKGITEDMVRAAGKRLLDRGDFSRLGNCVFLKSTALAENRLAMNIIKMAGIKNGKDIADFDKKLEYIERKFIGFHLSDEQKEAVRTALSNTVTVVTGGPGTGKTAIQKAMLKMFTQEYPDKHITCCAPTGKAARRMTEATGFSSSTIHHALGLLADEDGYCADTNVLEGDFIIVDEISMLDNSLADALFKSIKYSSQIVLVGDVDQLPSVGPGKVLKDIIDSGAVTVVRLQKVFRQKGGSRIAVNASLMKHGNMALEYGPDFQMIDSSDCAESAKIIADIYREEVEKVGLDNVLFLSPLRQRTETGVNMINPVLRDMINPPSQNLPEVKVGKEKIFRKGDKVTQMRNFDEISNGDLGYIVDIIKDDGDTLVKIDFGDDRVVEYTLEQLDMIELGYCTTIHKSQGSEAATIIISLQKLHYIMLNRPLIYTAITRGKKKVIIVGEKAAVCMAIKQEATSERYTGLVKRLRMNYFELLIKEREIEGGKANEPKNH